MRKRTLWVGAASAALLSVSAAGASAGIYDPSSESISTPMLSPFEDDLAEALYVKNNIVVTSEDGEYVKAQATHLALPFHADVSTTANKWRIKEAYIIIGLAAIKSAGVVGACCGSFTDFEDGNHAFAVDNNLNTEHLDKDSWWVADVDDKNFGTRARNTCRKLQQELQQQGMKNDEIFGQDRFAPMPTEFRLVARVGHKNPKHDLNEAGAPSIHWKQSQPYYFNINITCQRDMTSKVVGNPDPTPIPTGSGDIAMGFQVNQAALAITPNKYEAKCPAKLHLNPTIEATGKGIVRYRFVDQLGNKSQEFQVKFDKSDVKFLDHVIEIDGKGKPAGLGFAAAQPQGGALGLSANTQPNLTQGYFQLEVLAPHKKLSNLADYSVKCTVKTAGAGKLAPKPAVVGPVIVGELALGQPDLVIESTLPNPQNPATLYVQVRNKGTVASTPTNMKALGSFGRQPIVRGTLIPALQPNQMQVVLAELGGALSKAEALTLQIDDPNRIAESNEANNGHVVKN